MRSALKGSLPKKQMGSTSRGKLFYADASKGYTIKVLVDVLSGALSRATFHLGKEGVSIRKMDANTNILFDITLPREKFREYKCKREMDVSLNLKHLQKMIRNVKKKDSMRIFVDPKISDKLGFSIRPESGTSSRGSTRKETVFISVQREELLERLGLPEMCEVEDGKYEPVYGYPMVIGATDFQKVKKMTTIGKEIVIRMQKNNYISFYSDADIYSNMLEFGEILDNPESEEEDDAVGSDEDQDEISDNEEIIGESEGSSDSESDSEDEELSESDEEDDSLKGWYEASFYTSIISLLVKLPGLCSQMQFYAPRFGFPLKIKMDAGTGNSTLGTIQVYIKDIARINSQTSND